MSWLALITQCLGWRKTALQTLPTGTASWTEGDSALTTAEMQSISPGGELLNSSRALVWNPPTPPPTNAQFITLRQNLSNLFGALVSKTPTTPPVAEAKSSHLDDIIIGTFDSKYEKVSFQGTYSDQFSDTIQFTGSILLKDHALKVYGPIPSSANEDIKVTLNFKNFKIWKVCVAIPYPYARSRLPQLPELPSLPETVR